MQRELNNKLLFLGLLIPGFFWANMAKAVCPLCVVAVGAGLGFSRWLGVDDVVSSIWIGALLVSIIWWTLIEMKKKNLALLNNFAKRNYRFSVFNRVKNFPYDAIIISMAYYLLTFVPLYYAGIVGHPLNKIFGIDKIVFGTAMGTVICLLAHWLNIYLKKKNNGKVFFLYQKVVIPVVILILTSLTFYLLILWKII